MKDIPLVVLIATIWAYWLGVAIMVIRVRHRNQKLVGLVPEQRVERFMWLEIIWVRYLHMPEPVRSPMQFVMKSQTWFSPVCSQMITGMAKQE